MTVFPLSDQMMPAFSCERMCQEGVRRSIISHKYSDFSQAFGVDITDMSGLRALITFYSKGRAGHGYRQ